MKRGTLTKFAALCGWLGWRVALHELAKVPGCDEFSDAVDKLYQVMHAEKRLAEVRKIAGVPPE